MKKIIFLLSLALFASCGITMYSVHPNRISKTNIEINKEYTKDIGSPLIVKQEMIEQDAIIINSFDPLKIDMISIPYIAGDIVHLNGQNEEFLFYFDEEKKISNYHQIGFVENKQTGEFKAFVKNTAGGFFTKEATNFEYKKTKTIPRNCDNCFKQEFIYNGRVNNNLKFVYREYVDNLARSSFTQELQYDINDSKVIGFKGLRIDVLNTTNTSITYKVLSPFE